MKISINTSIDISEKEQNELTSHFNEEYFEIKNEIYKPGATATTLVVEFLLSALVGGFIYDQVKYGISKITNRPKDEKSRSVIFKIYVQESTYIVENNEAKEVDQNGVLVPIENLDEMFSRIKKEIKKEAER